MWGFRLYRYRAIRPVSPKALYSSEEKPRVIGFGALGFYKFKALNKRPA